MGNLVTWTLFFEFMELNLEKYEYFVFFQVGILDTSKYSTWIYREKQDEPIRETFIFRVDEVELGNIRHYYYRIFPSRNSRHFEMFDLEKNRENRESIRIEKKSSLNLVQSKLGNSRKIEKTGRQPEKRRFLTNQRGLILKSRIKLELSK